MGDNYSGLTAAIAIEHSMHRYYGKDEDNEGYNDKTRCQDPFSACISQWTSLDHAKRDGVLIDLSEYETWPSFVIV